MIPDLKAMTLEEKLLMMRDLWDDLRGTVENSEEPHQIRAILEERNARVESGEAKLLEWDEVKANIGSR